MTRKQLELEVETGLQLVEEKKRAIVAGRECWTEEDVAEAEKWAIRYFELGDAPEEPEHPGDIGDDGDNTNPPPPADPPAPEKPKRTSKKTDESGDDGANG